MSMDDVKQKRKPSWVEVMFYVFIIVAVVYVFVRALKKSQNVILWNPAFGITLLERSLSKLSQSLQ
jgi:bacteriorhodopsin